MSETRLNIVTSETIHEGTVHASIADLCVAALSAEPETFAEIQSALTRYPSDLIIDDDCPICVMSAQDAAAGIGIGFQHFDGSHMDDDFVFSFFDTREAWEEENLRMEEFNRDFDRRWKQREARLAAGESAAIVDAALGFAYSREFEEGDVSDAELIG